MKSLYTVDDIAYGFVRMSQDRTVSGDHQLRGEADAKVLIRYMNERKTGDLRIIKVFSSMCGATLYNVLDIDDKPVNKFPLSRVEAEELVSSFGEGK